MRSKLAAYIIIIIIIIIITTTTTIDALCVLHLGPCSHAISLPTKLHSQLTSY
jgi:hypothetical protein